MVWRSMVELRSVSCVAGGVRILDDVSVRFKPGAFNVIVGPNGAGKSTLLRVATGLRAPDAGTVHYGDRLASELSMLELARARAVLSQQVLPAFPLPAEDVVLAGRSPHYGMLPTHRDLEIVSKVLDLVGMASRRRQSYATLSGGEQQKVQLARVLAQIWSDTANNDGEIAGKVLFLDEPTASLDVHYQLHVLGVAAMLRDRGYTVVAVLHDLNRAVHFADHLMVLSNGRLAYETARPEDVPVEVLERVFDVRARRLRDVGGDGAYWSFALHDAADRGVSRRSDSQAGGAPATPCD
jgi:iron complex transport system ATP-binding protein